jgi:histidinol dehydrogenase
MHCSQRGADALGRVAATLALGEGLAAHAASATVRVDDSDRDA